LGRLYADLGAEFRDKACAHYLQAIQNEDRKGRAPIKAIEQLAALEARIGEEQASLHHVERAMARLQHLHDLVEPGDGGAADLPRKRSICDGSMGRAELLASVFRSKAVIFARAMLEARAGGANPGTASANATEEAFWTALTASIDAHERAARGDQDLLTAPTVQWLLLVALDRRSDECTVPLKLDLARRCAAAASAAFTESAAFSDAITASHAHLAQTLLDRSLGAEAETGLGVLAAVRASYQSVLAGVTARPKELEAVVRELSSLALCCQAVANTSADAETARIAERLQALADFSTPDAAKRVRSPNAHEAAAARAVETP
jgi:hypothetical protein